MKKAARLRQHEECNHWFCFPFSQTHQAPRLGPSKSARFCRLSADNCKTNFTRIVKRGLILRWDCLPTCHRPIPVCAHDSPAARIKRQGPEFESGLTAKVTTLVRYRGGGAMSSF